MRAQVVGIEAVLADGSVVSRLAGLPKDNTGYDLVSLLAGAEGTLGVITRLRLRLVPLLAARAVALVAVAGTAEAVELVRADARVAVAGGRRAVLRRRPRAGARAHRPAGAVRRAAPGVRAARVRRPRRPDRRAAGRARGGAATSCSMRRWRAMRAAGAALWAYRESHTESINAAACRSSSTSRCRWPRSRSAVAALPAADRRGRARARGRSCSGTSTRATCTSTCSTRSTTTRRSATRCCGWLRRTAGRSAPSTASAGPSASGWRCPARRGDRDDARDQGRPRPGRPAQPRRPALSGTARLVVLAVHGA